MRLFNRRHPILSKSLKWKKVICATFFVIFVSHFLLMKISDVPKLEHKQKSNNETILPPLKNFRMSNKINLWESYPNFSWREVVKEKPRDFRNATKIFLLSSNPRSGSSFMGELISAMPNVSYFFEPLWFFGSSPNKSMNEKMEFVGTMLDCRFSGLRRLLSQTKGRAFIFRKPSIIPNINMRALGIAEKRKILTIAESKCLDTHIRIAKFFRLRLADILPLMSNQDSILGQKIKIILLLRDPRAIINSIMKAPHEWKNFAQNPRMACTNTYNDMTAYNSILGTELEERILIVKYEDLIKKPKETTDDLYNFMGVKEFAKYGLEYLKDHISDMPRNKTEHKEVKENEEFLPQVQNQNATNLPPPFDNITVGDLEDYFTTFRNKSYRPDHWRTQLSSKQVSWIEEFPDCQSAIEILNYS